MGNLQYKGANVSSITPNDDDGTIRAIVSVTGIEDNVKDIIAPGAYTKSLEKRIPKGVWQHQWTESIAKTTAIKELMPGDPDLPKTLANGQPWPANAGGLMVDMVFNMKTQRGRESYEDVKFFAEQQEWSIGYSVPPGGATKDAKSGVRTIHTLDLYEYSPVLFGAMSNARTTSVKDAQNAFLEMKSLFGDDAERIMEMTKDIFEKSGKPTSDDDQDDDLEDIDEEDADTREEKGENMNKLPSNDLIENAINALQALLQGAGNVEHEEKSHEEKSLFDLMDSVGVEGKMLDTADEFDEAIDSGDLEMAQKSAIPVLDLVEGMISMDGLDEKTADVFRECALYIGENIADLEGKSENIDEDEDIDDEEDADEELSNEEKSFNRVATSNRFNKTETKSLIENDGLSLFAEDDTNDFGF